MLFRSSLSVSLLSPLLLCLSLCLQIRKQLCFLQTFSAVNCHVNILTNEDLIKDSLQGVFSMMFPDPVVIHRHGQVIYETFVCDFQQPTGVIVDVVFLQGEPTLALASIIAEACSLPACVVWLLSDVCSRHVFAVSSADGAHSGTMTACVSQEDRTRSRPGSPDPNLLSLPME